MQAPCAVFEEILVPALEMTLSSRHEGVCAFQEGVYANEVSFFEMGSQNLSSLFSIFFFATPSSSSDAYPPMDATSHMRTRLEASASRERGGPPTEGLPEGLLV